MFQRSLYVSHVDLFGNLRYTEGVLCDIKFPGDGSGARPPTGPSGPVL